MQQARVKKGEVVIPQPVVALVYFVLIYPGSYLSARLERRLAARD